MAPDHSSGNLLDVVSLGHQLTLMGTDDDIPDGIREGNNGSTEWVMPIGSEADFRQLQTINGKRDRGETLTADELDLWERMIEKPPSCQEIIDSPLPQTAKDLMYRLSQVGAQPIDEEHGVYQRLKEINPRFSDDQRIGSALRAFGIAQTKLEERGQSRYQARVEALNRVCQRLDDPIAEEVRAIVEELERLESIAYGIEGYTPTADEMGAPLKTSEHLVTQALDFLDEEALKHGQRIHGPHLPRALQTYRENVQKMASTGRLRPHHKGHFALTGESVYRLSPHHPGHYAALWASYPKEMAHDPQKTAGVTTLLASQMRTLARIANPAIASHWHTIVADIAGFVAFLDRFSRNGQLHRTNWTIESPAPFQWKPQTEEDLDQVIDPQCRIQVDEKLIVCHMLQGLSRMVTRRGINLKNARLREQVRDIFLKALEQEIPHLDREDAETSIFAKAVIEDLFQRADRLFPIHEETPAPSPPPDDPPPPAAPQPTVEKARPIQSFKDLQQLLNLGNRQKDLNGAKRGEHKKREVRIAEIETAVDQCQNLATTVPTDVKGTIGGIARLRTWGSVKACFIEREAPEQVWPAGNISSKGYFEIEDKRATYRLDWKLRNDGAFEVIIGEESFGEDDFQPTKKGNQERLYLELKRIVIKGLKERLTQTQEQELTERTRLIKGRKIPQLGIPNRNEPGVTHVRPRMTHLIPSKKSQQSEEESAAQPTRMAQMIEELLERMQTGDPIKNSAFEAISVFRAVTQETSLGEQTIYIPIEPLDTLKGLHERTISPEDVFICTGSRGMGRCGYFPRRRGDRLECYPKEMGDESQALRETTEEALGITLSDDGILDLTTISLPDDITEVMIGTRRAVDQKEAPLVTRTQIEQFEAEGDEGLPHELHGLLRQVFRETITVDDASGETRDRIQAVVFNAPQNPQFRKGTFKSITEVCAK